MSSESTSQRSKVVDSVVVDIEIDLETLHKLHVGRGIDNLCLGRLGQRQHSHSSRTRRQRIHVELMMK
jgi:hypothetical protein